MLGLTIQPLWHRAEEENRTEKKNIQTNSISTSLLISPICINMFIQATAEVI